MPQGMNHLRQAAAVLRSSGDRPPRDELANALRQVWLASGSSSEWPPELRSTAEALIALAFRDGTIRDSVDAMAEAELLDAAAAVRQLAAAAGVLVGGRR